MNSSLCVSDSAAESAEWVIVMFLTQINVMQNCFSFLGMLKISVFRYANNFCI